MDVQHSKNSAVVPIMLNDSGLVSETGSSLVLIGIAIITPYLLQIFYQVLQEILA